MYNWKHPLSPQLSEVLKAAEAAAEKYSVGYIGTEHLLLGLMQTPCAASKILMTVRVDAPSLTTLISRLIASENQGPASPRAYSLKAREALAGSETYCERLHKESVGTDHLLFALLLLVLTLK